MGVWPLAGRAASRFTVDTWTTDEHLPQNSVIAITQTRDGYLWLGTLKGLVRFDGVRFTSFDQFNTPGLGSSGVIKLFEDSQTNLWIATASGGLFLAKEGRVLSLEVGGGSREGSLASICEDDQGGVWLYTANGQLCRYSNGSNSCFNMGGSESRAMIADASGVIWVAADKMLLGQRSPKKGRVAGLGFEFEVPIGIKLDYLLASHRGGYWRLANGLIQKWQGAQVERTLGQYPWTKPVNAACEDPQGNLIVATAGDGVFWFGPDGQFERLTTANGLSENIALSVCMDREGDLWVGTDGGGLDRVRRQVFNVLENSKGLPVRSVCADNKGGIWVGYGTSNPRIEHLEGGVSGQFGSRQGLADLLVRSVFEDRQGHVWAGTYLGGLLQLQGEKFRLAPGAELFPRNQEYSAIYQDRSNQVWVGSQAGLARWNGSDWKLYGVKDGLSSPVVRTITEDRQGVLWIGTERGLTRSANGGFISFHASTNGLPSDSVWSLYADEAGVLWITTSGGLARYHEGKWTPYTVREGLASNWLGYLQEDEQGYLWVGSNWGLMRLRKKDLNDFAEGKIQTVHCRTFGKADGLPTGECSEGSQPAACRTPDGTLWFSTIKGLVSVNPRQLVSNTNPPPVLIEAVYVDNQLQGTNSLRASAPDSIVIPAGREELKIQFTSLNLAAPENGRFKYRLENPLESREKNWTETPASVRSVSYPKLPPGEYKFVVTACNEDEVWNPVGASLAITVEPPFWKTKWFLTLTSALLLGIIVGIVSYFSTQRLQRQLVAMRQQEAVEKERGRIARDLHDQLGANLTQVALLSEMAEADKELPEEVESHARQIGQTARETTHALDEIVWTVNPSNDTLEGLINYVCKYAQDYLAMADLKYRLEVPPQLPQTPISPEVRHNVFLAAKEAVNNVVKHSKATSAWVRLRLEPTRFILEIEDNGAGLSADAREKGRNGLRNMQKRLEDLGGRFELGPGAEGGTLVRLTAPVAPDAKGNPI